MTEGQDKTETLEELKKITTDNTVHKKRADVFYKHKRTCRAKAQKQPTHGAICMEYQNQLPVATRYLGTFTGLLQHKIGFKKTRSLSQFEVIRTWSATKILVF